MWNSEYCCKGQGWISLSHRQQFLWLVKKASFPVWSNCAKFTNSYAISAKRGRPLYLPEELDKNFSGFITHMWMAGETINCHMVFGVLTGLIKSDIITYRMYLEMDGSSLSISAYESRRIYMTVFTWYCWCRSDIQHSHELIINVVQTPLKYVPTENVSMAVKNLKRYTERSQ